jgi:hypothetical protein
MNLFNYLKSKAPAEGQPFRFKDLDVAEDFVFWLANEIAGAVIEKRADSLDDFLLYLSEQYPGLELEGYQQNIAEDLLGTVPTESSPKYGPSWSQNLIEETRAHYGSVDIGLVKKYISEVKGWEVDDLAMGQILFDLAGGRDGMSKVAEA